MKNALIIVSAIVFVIGAVILTIPLWLDIKDHKAKIAQVIQKKTGLDIDIKGDITIRAIPDLSLKLKKISMLSNISGNTKNIFADELLVKIKFLPLFRKMLEVDSFEISNLVIDIIVNSKEDSSGLGLEGDKLINTEVLENKDEDLLKILLDVDSEKFYDKFLLSSLVVDKGTISYINKQDGIKINISIFNLNTSLKPGNNKFKFSGKLDIFSDKNKGLLTVDGNYFFTGKKIQLDDFIFNLDNVEIHNNFIADMEGERPLVKISLYTGEINLNEYNLDIFEKTKDSVAEISNLTNIKVEQKPFKYSEEEFKLNKLNLYDIYFNFKTSGLSYKDFKIGPTELYSHIVNGIGKLSIKDCNVYAGSVKSDALIDISGEIPNIKNKIEFSNIDLSIVPENIKYLDITKGNISGDLFFNSIGNNVQSLVSNLDGVGRISISDGVLKGIDLLSMVTSFASVAQGANIRNATKFSDISANYDIKKGIIFNDNFILKSDVLNFAGNGQINLNNLSIDYKLLPKYSQDLAESDKKELPNFPIVILGDIMHPDFRLEVKSIVTDLIENPKSGENLVNQMKKDFKDMQGDLKNKSIIDLKNLFD